MLISCPLCGVGLLVDAPHKCFLGQRATPKEVERARESALANLTKNQEGAAIMSKGISPISAVERVRAVEHDRTRLPSFVEQMLNLSGADLERMQHDFLVRFGTGMLPIAKDKKQEGADDGK